MGVDFCQRLAGGDTRTALSDGDLQKCLHMLLQLREPETPVFTTLRLLKQAAVVAQIVLDDPDFAA